MKAIANINVDAIISVIKDNYNVLTAREKIVGLCVMSVIVFIFGNFLLISPLKKAVIAMTSEAETLITNVEDAQLKIDLLMAEVENSLANPGSAQSRTLQGQMQDLDAKLKGYYDQLIPASQIGTALQKTLASQDGLKLLSIRSLPVKEVLSYQPAKSEEMVKLFRKGMEIVFQGGYFTTIAYLKKLEGMEKKLIWGSLTYEVSEYPNATVTLHVYTLSTEGGASGS